MPMRAMKIIYEHFEYIEEQWVEFQRRMHK